MIRGPILPQARERLWSIVQQRLDAVESGLELVLESLDCSAGEHGMIDGLCRDAAGAPVLVALAVDGDALLLPRMVAAAAFVDRIGDALAEAVPEGSFCSGARVRLLVIGTETSTTALQALSRLDLPLLELCRLEPFRLAGSERFAVRWFGANTGGAIDAVAPQSDRDAVDVAADPTSFGSEDSHWQAIVTLCERLDPGVRIDGDRFRRRVTWHGRVLGHVASIDGALVATAADGSETALLTKSDVRTFGDRLMRRYAELAGLRPIARQPSERAPDPVRGRDGAVEPDQRAVTRDDLRAATQGGNTLRSAMAEAFLSPEEFAALTEPPDAAMPNDSPD